jgi:hypothetical protein
MAKTQNADAPEGPDAAAVASVAAGGLALVLALGALALFGTRTALSVAAGGTIAVANLVTMSAIVRALLRAPDDEPSATADANATPDASATPDANATSDGDASSGETVEADAPDHAREGKRGGAAWGAFAVVKIIVLFGGIWILLTKGMVDPMPLVVGYGVLPLGIAASSLYTSLLPRSRGPGRRNRSK